MKKKSKIIIVATLITCFLAGIIGGVLAQEAGIDGDVANVYANKNIVDNGDGTFTANISAYISGKSKYKMKDTKMLMYFDNSEQMTDSEIATATSCATSVINAMDALDDPIKNKLSLSFYVVSEDAGSSMDDHAFNGDHSSVVAVAENKPFSKSLSTSVLPKLSSYTRNQSSCLYDCYEHAAEIIDADKYKDSSNYIILIYSSAKIGYKNNNRFNDEYASNGMAGLDNFKEKYGDITDVYTITISDYQDNAYYYAGNSFSAERSVIESLKANNDNRYKDYLLYAVNEAFGEAAADSGMPYGSSKVFGYEVLQLKICEIEKALLFMNLLSDNFTSIGNTEDKTGGLYDGNARHYALAPEEWGTFNYDEVSIDDPASSFYWLLNKDIATTDYINALMNRITEAATIPDLCIADSLDLHRFESVDNIVKVKTANFVEVDKSGIAVFDYSNDSEMDYTWDYCFNEYGQLTFADYDFSGNAISESAGTGKMLLLSYTFRPTDSYLGGKNVRTTSRYDTNNGLYTFTNGYKTLPSGGMILTPVVDQEIMTFSDTYVDVPLLDITPCLNSVAVYISNTYNAQDIVASAHDDGKTYYKYKGRYSESGTNLYDIRHNGHIWISTGSGWDLDDVEIKDISSTDTTFKVTGKDVSIQLQGGCKCVGDKVFSTSTNTANLAVLLPAIALDYTTVSKPTVSSIESDISADDLITVCEFFPNKECMSYFARYGFKVLGKVPEITWQITSTSYPSEIATHVYESEVVLDYKDSEGALYSGLYFLLENNKLVSDGTSLTPTKQSFITTNPDSTYDYDLVGTRVPAYAYLITTDPAKAIYYKEVGGESQEEEFTTDYEYVVKNCMFEKTGYSFVDWSLDPSIATENYAPGDHYTRAVADGDTISFIANWKINRYTITFDTKGGTPIAPITQDYSTAIAAPANPTKAGYTFDGWDVAIPTNMPAKNMTITAKWKVNSHKVIFDMDGGEDISPITFNYGDTVVLNVTPTKENYIFMGWKEAVPETMPDEDVTLTATWEGEPYALTYQTNGGTPISPVTLKYGDSFPTATTTKVGYTFKSWSYWTKDLTGGSVKYNDVTMPAADVVAEANWTANDADYEVRYYVMDTDGNYPEEDSPTTTETKTGKIDETITFKPDSRKGFTLDTENSTLTGTISPNYDTMKLNVYFKRNKYDVTINFSGAGEDTPATYKDKVFYEKQFEYTVPTITGYTADETAFSFKMSNRAETKDVTYTANDYTISFEENGGSTVSDITQKYRTSVSKPADPAKTGYTFKGWYEDSSFGGTEYVFSTMPAKDTTLYAKWEINQYTITFDTDGGSEVAPITQNYNTAITAPADPTKTGYTFDGWDKTIPAKMPANDTTIKAKWKVNQYTITFETDGGSKVPAITQNYNTDVTAPTDPTKEGYTFKGWDKAIPSKMPANDLTITAQWKINKYTITYKLDGKEYITTDYDFGAVVTSEASPSKTGHTFSGWTWDTSDTKAPSKMPAKDLTATGTLTANSHTITWKKGDKSSVDNVKFGDKITVPADPSKTGNTFTKWLTSDSKEPSDYVTVPDKDLVFVAQFKINQYTITFDTDGGSEIAPIKQDYDSAITAPTNPTKTGYTFDGWDKTIPTKMPAENTTIKAKWTINQYTITFDTDGGSKVPVITQNYNTDVSAPKDPTKTGYTFDGWDKTVPSKMPAKDMTIKAKWVVNQYTITFDTNGGTSIPSITQNYNTDIVKPANPTKTGYTFNAWDKTIPSKMPAEDMTITASWNINQYTITFETNGGSKVPAITQNYNTDITAPANPTKTGYTFDGWDKTIPSKMPAKDVTINAKWTINQYTITFDTDGGSTVPSITQNYNTDVIAPANPTKTGYTFDGWDKVVPSKMPAEDITIKAKWTINQYTITFDTDGGSKVPAITQNYNTDVTAPADPTKTGYTFKGWDKTIPSKMPAKDITITAQWNINKYTITFDTDGGSEIPAITQDYDTAITAPTNPTKTGYTFDGWDKVVPTKMPANDTTIKAKWKINQYTITFETNGGTKIPAITQNYNTDITAPANPTKTGYTFDGWDKTIPAKMPAKDVTINAKWTINQYTITFNTNGGSAVPSITQDYNTNITKPANPTKTGYTFNAWDKTIPDKMPAEDVTITASWNINQYTITFDTDGGSKVPAITQNYNTDVTVPADPTKTGYTFAGWDKTIPSKMPAKDLTIKAKWDINQYTVEFDTDGGSKIAPITQDYNTDITAPANPTKTGYTFDGWDKVIPTKMPAEDVTIKAKWIINQYTITFETNGGSKVPAITQNYNTDVTAPASPTKTGYTFDGWDKTIPAKMPAKDVTISAKWTINQYTITFDTDGGSAVPSITQNYNTDIVAPADPTKTGYTFDGWDKVIPSKMPAEDTTIKAKWTINQYTITFNTNGGTNIPSITKDYGTTIVAPDDPTKEGYVFNSWDKDIPKTMPAKDIAINANWDIESYTLRFDTDGGTKISDIKKEYNANITAPKDPTKTGYTFEGWYEESTFKTPYTIPEKMPDLGADETIKTIYAKWKVNSYSIEFDTAGGSKVKTITQDYGTKITVPADPTKTGYTFVGWDKEIPSTMPAKDMKITADWKINQYTIRFSNTGDTLIRNIILDYGSTITKPSDPVRKGFTFAGWDKTIPDTMPAYDMVITGQWDTNEYTITFDTKGGSKIEPITQKYGTNVVAPENPTKTGYEFNSWDQEIPKTMPFEDITINANWDIESYTIRFNSNGGSDVKDITKNYNEAIDSPANPTRTGYTFNGWFENEECTDSYSIPKVMPDLGTNGTIKTVYADWQINEYTITFDTDGGSNIPPITQNYDTNIVAPSDPTKTGYTFNGWDKTIPSKMPAEDVTIKANWKINQYTITFDTDGGNEIKPITQDYNTKVTAPDDPEKEGYTFDGWDTVIPEKMPASDVEIKALWKINQYTITFNTNGGTEIEPITQDYGTSITVPKSPSKRGHVFAGWDKEIPSTMPAKNITINANWEVKSFTLRFETDGGTEIADITKEYGESVVAPKDPTKTGYTFKGWYADQKCAIKFTIPDTMPDYGVNNTVKTIYAKWAVNQYIISFITDGGTIVPSICQDYNTDITAPDDPTKTGYSFKGWDTTIPEKMPAYDMKISAKWEINQYTLTFDTDGGTEIPSITQNYNTNVNCPDDPTKEGYTFKGWDEDIPSKMPAESKTFTAQWQINQYTVTFDTDGGSKIEPITQDYGTNITKPEDPTKTGYTFAGWDKKIPTTMPANDVNIKAVWKINQYTIDFDTDGGTKIPSINQDYATKITKPADPEKEGYTFKGWDKVIPDNMPAENLTIKAIWDINQYTISFDTNGGSPIDDITQDYATKITKPNDPTRSGYTFVGWDKDIPNTMPSKDMDITAQWKKNTYIIHFELDGGSKVDDIKGLYGSDITIPNNPTKTGYTFKGWYEDALFTSEYTIPSKMPDYGPDGTTKTVYAKWDINEYTITFDTDGGTPVSPITQDYNTVIVKPADPTKTGYSFVKWSEEIPSNMPAEDKEIKAIWKINQYSITFNTDGGSKVDKITQDYATNVIAPKDPIKEGYTFKGWDKEIPSTMPAEDTEITALWDINEYTITFKTNGGTEIEPITQDYATDIECPAEPTKTGYTFVKWSEPVPEKMPAKDMTIEVEWKANKYTIEFNANTGAGEMSPLNMTYDEQNKLPTNTFTKEGYTFTGWADENGKEYDDGENVLNLTSKDGETIKFFAQWSANSYTVNFDANGGSGSMDSKDMTYDVRYQLPSNTFAKAKSTFSGWNTKKDGTGISYKDAQTVKNIATHGEITLYACWTTFEKTSTIVGDDCKPGNSIEYTISIAIPEASERVIITDTIPQGTTYNDDANNGGLYNDGTITWTFEDGYAAGKVFTVKFSVLIDEETKSGNTITNTAKAYIDDVEFTSTTASNDISFARIIYHANTGKNTVPNDATYYTIGETASVMGNGVLAKDNNKFFGWNTSAAGDGKHYNPGDKIVMNEDVNLYAQWVKGVKTAKKVNSTLKPGDEIEYTISITPTEDCSNAVVTDVIPEHTTYVHGSTSNVTIKDRELKWIFSKMKANTEYVITFRVKLNADAESHISIDNTAIFTVNNNSYRIGSDPEKDDPTVIVTDKYFNVVYDLNGGDGTTPKDNTNYSEDASVKIADNSTFSNGNYLFTGWNTKANGTGTHYNAGATIEIKENIKLYAQWTLFTKTSKVLDSSMKPGAEIEYTVQITVPEPTEKVTITDTVPDGLRIAENTVDNGIIDGNNITWTFEREIKSGETLTVTFKAIVKSKYQDGSSIIDGDEFHNTAAGYVNNYSFTSTTASDKIGYHTVKYVSDGCNGDVPVDETYYTVGQECTVAKSGNLTKDGYNFIGWKDEKGNRYSEEEVITIHSDIIFHAIWAKFEKSTKTANDGLKPGDTVEYNLHVDIPDGVNSVMVVDDVPDALEIVSFTELPNAEESQKQNKITWIINNTENQSYDLNISTKVKTSIKAGTSFANTASADYGNGYVVNSKSVSNKLGYTLTYVSLGSTYTDGNYYSSGSNATISNPTIDKTGYQFLTWNTKADGSGTNHDVGSILVMNDNTTLYAMWGKVTKTTTSDIVKAGDTVTYTIVANSPKSNGTITIVDRLPGELEFVEMKNQPENAILTISGNTLTIEISNVTANKDYSIAIVTRVSDNALSGNMIGNVAEVSFDNQYTITSESADICPIYYTITYNANGGSGECPIDNTKYVIGDTATIQDGNNLSKGDKVFSGWSTSANGKGTNYAVGESVEMTKDLVLYATYSDTEEIETEEKETEIKERTKRERKTIKEKETVAAKEEDIAQTGSTQIIYALVAVISASVAAVVITKKRKKENE